MEDHFKCYNTWLKGFLLWYVQSGFWNKSQPIAIDDVFRYLVKAIDASDVEGRSFDIGGPDVLSYLDMMKRYGRMMNKSIKIIIIPFLTPRLSSYWIDLVTPLRASLARTLIDSLKHEAFTKDDTIKGIIPLQLKSFEEAIRAAKEEQLRKSNITRKERTSHSLNTKILLISLFVMAVIGSTYYVDPKPDVIHASWFVLNGLWYFGIAFSIYFVLKSTRLGSITAGIIGWMTLALWLTGRTLIVGSSDLVMVIRDFIGVVTAALVMQLITYSIK